MPVSYFLSSTIILTSYVPDKPALFTEHFTLRASFSMNVPQHNAANGVLAVEMETAELYTLAARYGVEALSILTISDHIFKGEETSPEERQNTFTEMMEIALELIK